MSKASSNAISAFRERLREPGLWVCTMAIPGIGIPIILALANPDSDARTVEQVLWVLSIIPLVFLSPFPWQWSESRFRLHSWKQALPLNALGGALAGILLTTVIVAIADQDEPFWSSIVQRIPVSVFSISLLSVGFGWPLANLDRLRAQVRAADAQAEASSWMRHRNPFPPQLLVRHLRYLSSQAEAAPLSTENGILLLAQLYRTWLGLTEWPLVSLEAERMLLEGFFEAENYRCEGSIHCDWEAFAWTGSWQLPPFCLFSLCAKLLETGARHFVFSVADTAHGLEIRLRCPDGFMQTFAETDAWKDSETRLSDAFGGKARLSLEDDRTIMVFLPKVAP